MIPSSSTRRARARVEPSLAVAADSAAAGYGSVICPPSVGRAVADVDARGAGRGGARRAAARAARDAGAARRRVRRADGAAATARALESVAPAARRRLTSRRPAAPGAALQPLAARAPVGYAPRAPTLRRARRPPRPRPRCRRARARRARDDDDAASSGRGRRPGRALSPAPPRARRHPRFRRRRRRCRRRCRSSSRRRPCARVRAGGDRAGRSCRRSCRRELPPPPRRAFAEELERMMIEAGADGRARAPARAAAAGGGDSCALPRAAAAASSRAQRRLRRRAVGEDELAAALGGARPVAGAPRPDDRRVAPRPAGRGRPRRRRRGAARAARRPRRPRARRDCAPPPPPAPVDKRKPRLGACAAARGTGGGERTRDRGDAPRSLGGAPWPPRALRAPSARAPARRRSEARLAGARARHRVLADERDRLGADSRRRSVSTVLLQLERAHARSRPPGPRARSPGRYASDYGAARRVSARAPAFPSPARRSCWAGRAEPAAADPARVASTAVDGSGARRPTSAACAPTSRRRSESRTCRKARERLRSRLAARHPRLPGPPPVPNKRLARGLARPVAGRAYARSSRDARGRGRCRATDDCGRERLREHRADVARVGAEEEGRLPSSAWPVLSMRSRSAPRSRRSASRSASLLRARRAQLLRAPPRPSRLRIGGLGLALRLDRAAAARPRATVSNFERLGRGDRALREARLQRGVVRHAAGRADRDVVSAVTSR